MKNIIICFSALLLVVACKKKEEPHIMTDVKDLNTVPLEYPQTEKDSTSFNILLAGKEKVADPYQWLEDDKSPKTLSWGDSQMQLTLKYLKQIPYREEIRARLKELNQYEKVSTPYKKGGYYFFAKNNGLQDQAVTYYKKGLDGKEEVFLDPNKLSKKGTTAAQVLSFSKDKKYAVININEAGSDWSYFKIKDVEKNEFLPDSLGKIKFSDAAWYKDGFFYSRFAESRVPQKKGSKYSAKNQFQEVYYHKMGDPQTQDELVYVDKNPESFSNFYTSSDEQYFILNVSQGTGGNKVFVAAATDDIRKVEWKEAVDDYANENTVIDVKNNQFYMLTDREAPNKRLVTFTLDQCEEGFWKEVIPENDNLLSEITMGGGKLFANYLEKASTKVYQLDLDGKNKLAIELPTLGTASGFDGEDEDTSVFYSFSSLTYPTTIYEYNIKDQKSTEYFSPKISFNPADYETKQVWYTSKDGTKVPMFITCKKGLELNGDNPTYLYGYGGFNINVVPTFNVNMIAFLERGGVYAVPNLRGGGEFGAAWHQAGMLDKKQNVFDDFIGAADYLIQQKYTRKEKLALSGRSNGGLLVGATMTQRPDLAQVAFPEVGVMDMLKYDQFTIGWGWADEYGKPNDPKMFPHLKKYSPVHNVKETQYPATMVATADHDDRVVPAHSFKFIAELQSKNQDKSPVLIRIDKNAGHGAGKSLNMQIDEMTDKWSFLFFNMGYKELPKKTLD